MVFIARRCIYSTSSIRYPLWNKRPYCSLVVLQNILIRKKEFRYNLVGATKLLGEYLYFFLQISGFWNGDGYEWNGKFDVHRSVHCKSISQYNQQDAKLQTLFIFLWNALHVWGGSSAHHQELKDCMYSIGYFVKPLLLPATVVAGSRKGLTKYPMLYMQFFSSWWWEEEPPETCRAFDRNK